MGEYYYGDWCEVRFRKIENEKLIDVISVLVKESIVINELMEYGSTYRSGDLFWRSDNKKVVDYAFWRFNKICDYKIVDSDKYYEYEDDCNMFQINQLICKKNENLYELCKCFDCHSSRENWTEIDITKAFDYVYVLIS